jgi:hypothetical protein
LVIVDIEAFGYRTLAGNELNWLYAAYELDQLRETFADVAEILPKYRDLSVPDLITSTVKIRWRPSTGQSRPRTASNSPRPTRN